MSEIGTTNIDDLPTNNVLNNESSNNSNDYNALVNDIQKATVNGNLSLPSKDIPTTQEHITHDVNTQTNYVPPPKEKDYIQEEEKRQPIQETKNVLETQSDYLLEEFQTPILITICFILFQIPLFKDKMINLIPIMFKNDLQLKTSGIIIQAIMFGVFYYGINKTMIFLLE